VNRHNNQDGQKICPKAHILLECARLRYPILGLIVLLCFIVPALPQQPAEIAVILEKDSKVYNLTFDRFRELAQQGARVPVSVVPYPLEGDGSNGPDLMSRIQAKHSRLIFAIGNNAAQLAHERSKDIPILYSMVLNPSKHDLGRANICGISLDVSPKEQLGYFAKVKPSLKRVGTIYNPSASDNVIEEADAFARMSGFELVRKRAQNTKETLVAIRELEDEPLDAFLMILDPVVANDASFKVLLNFSLKKRIPLIVPAEPFVKAGALLSVGADYGKIGDQAWDIAKRILQGEVKPSDVGIRHPDAVVVAVNNTIARTLGLEVPRTLKVDIAY
jgi:putative ABC transport system substrate-binding protein